MPTTGSKKIDTVAAELVPRKTPGCQRHNSRRRILRKFRNATWGGVHRGRRRPSIPLWPLVVVLAALRVDLSLREL
jgi:hypothetical protein